MAVNNKTILYKCPYCVKGRFTAADGWGGALKHIREIHSRRVDGSYPVAARPKKTFEDSFQQENA